jgi:cyclopropane fatty-acyl-phospholipid synthase-like methyltransferase
MTAVKNEPSAKLSILSRLQAWWEGEDAQAQAPAEAAAAPAAGPEKRPAETIGWTDRRFAAAQRGFGPGCVLPGGDAAIRELLAPLKLKKDMRIVDFGARAGCLVRLAASEFGVMASGLESDPILVNAADDLIRQAKLGNAVSVAKAGLRNNRFGSRYFDAVVSREAMHLLPDKDEVYACCKDLLKPDGQLLFTDFMSRRPGVNPAIEVWAAHERIHAHLATPDEHRSLLEGHGFEILAFEDVSQAYRRQVAGSMQAFAEQLAQKGLDELDREWIMFEVDLWARRVDFVQSGDLGVSRVHARLAP